jgi:hypothetical protein
MSLLDSRHSPLTGASGDYVDGMWHRKAGAPDPEHQPRPADPIELLGQALADIDDLKSAMAAMADTVSQLAAQVGEMMAANNPTPVAPSPPAAPAVVAEAPAAPVGTEAPLTPLNV